MPVMPGYANADTPHARTVHLAAHGWRYGCHSALTGEAKPDERGRCGLHIPETEAQ